MARAKATRGELNERQEKFCQLFASSDKEFFGNGVQSYIEAYEPDQSKPNWYKSACQSASQLLSNIKVCARISELLDTGGFNDENVKKQHLFLINQYADAGAKQKAISDFYKLKGKYAPDEVKLTIVDPETVQQRLQNLRAKK